MNCSHGSTMPIRPAKYTTPKISPNFQKSRLSMKPLP